MISMTPFLSTLSSCRGGVFSFDCSLTPDEGPCEADPGSCMVLSPMSLDRPRWYASLNIFTAFIFIMVSWPAREGWTPPHEINPPQTIRLIGSPSSYTRRFIPWAKLSIVDFDGGFSKKKLRCKSPWGTDSSMLSDALLSSLPISGKGAIIIRSSVWTPRSNWTGTWSRGKSGASLTLQDNSERVSLTWSLTRASRAHISAVVKDPLPGLKVVLPDAQAPRNSKDLKLSAGAGLMYGVTVPGSPSLPSPS